MKNRSVITLIYAVFNALIVWFGLALQFYISIERYLALGRTLAGSLVQIFSYFTILSNLLVAIVLTVILIKPNSAAGKFCSRLSVLTATTVYIVIVGLVYNLVLRQIWDPQGLFKLADDLLHTISPLLFLFFWLLFVQKYPLQWKVIFNWAIYPIIYLIYSLLRGVASGLYPYDFIDAKQIGYGQTAINSFFVLLAFLAVSAIFIGITRTSKKIR
jgi:hypothetical protein